LDRERTPATFAEQPGCYVVPVSAKNYTHKAD
jgi:hypothetical protein